jgi:hypothetical protein
MATFALPSLFTPNKVACWRSVTMSLKVVVILLFVLKLAFIPNFVSVLKESLPNVFP